jgi:hypothetical protein
MASRRGSVRTGHPDGVRASWQRDIPGTLTAHDRARAARVDSPAMALFGKKRRLTACAESGG